MKAVLCLVFCLALSFATESDDIALINKIEQTPLGKTLFDTIYMQLKSGDPLETLVSTLHDLEDRYIVEQKEDDEQNSDFQDACNSDISAYDKDIAMSERERISYLAKLEGDLYPRREIMTNVVNQKTHEVADYQKQLDEIDAQRAEQAENFEQIVHEHNEATSIITEVRRMFEEDMGNEGSFLQKGGNKSGLKSETITMVQKHMQEGVRRAHKFTHKKRFSALFKMFATITSKTQQLADEGHLSKIVVLCDQLLFQIEESLDLERFAEDKRIEAYKKNRNLLSIAQMQAKTDLANAQTELASINDNITQVETALDNTNQRLVNLNESRQDRWDQCEEAAHDYMESRAARDADRQVVSDTIGLVNQSLRTLKEQLAQRLAAGDSFDY